VLQEARGAIQQTVNTFAVQETTNLPVSEEYIEATRRYGEYRQAPRMPFYLWLRFLTVQQLLIVHRRHLLAKMRSVSIEVPLPGNQEPDANMAMLAEELSGNFTSPSSAAARKEVSTRLTAALNALDTRDREILTLRHFEQLKTVECAQVLGISESLASMRYGRAVRRLMAVMKELFGTDHEFQL